MQNFNPAKEEQKSLIQTLPAEAQNILTILDEVEEFTLRMKQKLMAELKPEPNPEINKSTTTPTEPNRNMGR